MSIDSGTTPCTHGSADDATIHAVLDELRRITTRLDALEARTHQDVASTPAHPPTRPRARRSSRRESGWQPTRR